MRTIWTTMAVVGMLYGLTAPVAAQENARAVIERAVKAHGGLEQLTKARADHVKTKGKLFVGGVDAPFTAESWIQLPGQLKNVMDVEIRNEKTHLTQVLNGDEAWVRVGDKTVKADGALLADMKETLHMDRVVRLAPLLKEKEIFKLTLLPQTKVDGKPAVGVQVDCKGHKDVRLYFDQKSGLLVRTEHTVADNGKEVKQEEIYSDYRELGGYKRPIKVVAYRDGKKLMEAELTAAQVVDKIDGAEFKKP